jgi:hypothetical protein
VVGILRECEVLPLGITYGPVAGLSASASTRTTQMRTYLVVGQILLDDHFEDIAICDLCSCVIYGICQSSLEGSFSCDTTPSSQKKKQTGLLKGKGEEASGSRLKSVPQLYPLWLPLKLSHWGSAFTPP